MDIDLEEIVEGKLVLVDNSFLQSESRKNDMMQTLYDGRWEDVSDEDINFSRKTIQTLVELINKGYQIRAIPESIVEMEEFRKQLNCHRQYFKKPEMSKKKFKQHKGKDRAKKNIKKRQAWQENDIEMFTEYSQLCDEVHNFLRRLKHQGTSEIDQKRSLYQRIFGLVKPTAEKREKDKQEIYGGAPKQFWMKNPLNLGTELNTDQKLITSALVLTYEQPVLVLSRDKDITMISKAAAKKIKLINMNGQNGQFPIPAHELSVYGAIFPNESGEKCRFASVIYQGRKDFFP